MDFSVPIGRAEVGSVFLSVLLIGMGLGAMLAGLPHPTVQQHNISGVAMVMGIALWVGFLIFRAGKQWKARTSG